MSFEYEKPMGYRWRSSRTYVIACVTIALFSENFLYSFIVPILQTILEDRLHLDPSETQTTTSALLSTHALVCFIAGPITGHFADKFPSRKGPLLVSLGAEAFGTLIIAAATSLPVLFAGRIIQAIGGDAAWIVGFATIADVVGPDDTSRTLTTVSVFFMSGLLVGPLVSGILMQLIGYWPTWGTAIAVLAIDVIMRCIMIDSPKGARAQRNIKSQPAIESLDGKTSKTKVEEDPEAAEFDATPAASETSALLPRPWTTDQHTQSDGITASDEKPSGPSSLSFYKVILTNSHALTGMAFQATSALILVSFDATLPLHVARNFGWNTSQTSLMFLFLQMPTFILSPLTGWLRDRVGPRTPTGVGYLLTALFLWLLGTPGEDGLFWGSGERGQAVYMASLVGLGIARTLYAGSGVIEMTYAVKDLQGQKPHVFGPNGGFSKAYSLCNMSWTFGMLIGPVPLGSVNELAGYYYMNVLVAIISSVSSLLAFIYIGKS